MDKTPLQMGEFIKRFPFAATLAQEKAIEAIMGDFKKGYAMARLLEGDVGSGKTAVAAATAFAIITSRPAGQSFGHLQVGIYGADRDTRQANTLNHSYNISPISA